MEQGAWPLRTPCGIKHRMLLAAQEYSMFECASLQRNHGGVLQAGEDCALDVRILQRDKTLAAQCIQHVDFHTTGGMGAQWAGRPIHTPWGASCIKPGVYAPKVMSH